MNKITRYYFSLTNKCNADCDFCCMWSSSKKNSFLDFNRFKEIIDGNSKDFEIYLEGGEPFLNKHIMLFIEYAYYTGRCKQIIISTNGLLLHEYSDRLTDFLNRSKIPMVLKVSINYHLYGMDKNIFKRGRDLLAAVEFIENLKIVFNVRLRKGDDWIIDLLKENHLYDVSNVFYLQKYGRYEDKNEYDLPFIRQEVEEFHLFSTDGIDFGHDLVARSNHEKGVQ